MLTERAVLFVTVILSNSILIGILLVRAMKLHKIRREIKRVEVPQGWHKGAFIRRGAASAAGGFLVVYHLLDNGVWQNKLKTFAFETNVYHMNGLPLSNNVRIFPMEGDVVLESFYYNTIHTLRSINNEHNNE